MKQITVLFNGKFQTTWLLDEPHVVVGRGRSAHIPLDGNPIVSRQHAIIREEKGSHVLEDLGGANGTFLNDQKVLKPTPLHDGARITIGKHSMRYEAATPSAQTLKRARAEEKEDAAATAFATPLVGNDSVQPPWTLEGKKNKPPPISHPGIMESANATVAASKEELENLLAQVKLKSGPHLSWNLDGRIVIIPCDDPPIRIGNSDSFEVRIPGNKWFGKLAAELVKKGSNWALVAKSPFWNPVFVGKSKVAKRRKLSNGTTFKIGEHKLRFSAGE